jgi:hypothetical protein
MFVVTEAQAAMRRATYEQRPEFSAAVELRQLFPGITNNAQARLCVRTTAGLAAAAKAATPRQTAGWQHQLTALGLPVKPFTSCAVAGP